MKKLYATLLLLFAATAASIRPAAAQITIDEVEADRPIAILSAEPIPTKAAPYFSEARYRAERRAIRKERNLLEVGGGLMGTLSSYNDSWRSTSGGDNAIAAMLNVNLHHTFTKGKFFIESKFDFKFGYNRMNVETSTDAGTTSEGIWFKNQDEFVLTTAPAYKFSSNWSLASNLKFRSQIANGYLSRSEQEEIHRKSSFMAPGYFDISLGLTYACPLERFPIRINLSPIAMSSVFVLDETVRNNTWDGKAGWQAYGLASADKRAKYEGGSSVQIDYDHPFDRKGIVRYRTTLYSFYGWINELSRNAEEMPEAIHPTVRWENKIDIVATKYLTTTFSFQLYYNRAQNTHIQTQTLLSVGLTYTFRNK